MLVALLCILIFSSAFAEAQFCRVVRVAMKLPSLTFQRISLLGLKLFPEGRSSAPLDSPHTPFSQGQATFPYQVDPIFPRSESQISCSIKQFIHDAVRQKQTQLVTLRRDPQERNPMAIIVSV